MVRNRVPVYSIMLYIGAVIGIIAGTRWAAADGLAAEKVCAAMLLLLFPALFGARLLFVTSHWDVYRHQKGRIWRPMEGGATMYGGLILSFPASLPLLPAAGIDLWAFWDAGAVAMLIAMVFARVGCLLNGCCAGRPAEGWLAFESSNGHGARRPRFPSQLLEAGVAGLVLFASIRVNGVFPFHGSLFFTSLASYGTGRWLLEPTRETVDRIGGVSVNRMISAGFVVLGAVAFLLLHISQTTAAPPFVE